jgi:hypothetical protein
MVKARSYISFKSATSCGLMGEAVKDEGIRIYNYEFRDIGSKKGDGTGDFRRPLASAVVFELRTEPVEISTYSLDTGKAIGTPFTLRPTGSELHLILTNSPAPGPQHSYGYDPHSLVYQQLLEADRRQEIDERTIPFAYSRSAQDHVPCMSEFVVDSCFDLYKEREWSVSMVMYNIGSLNGQAKSIDEICYGPPICPKALFERSP